MPSTKDRRSESRRGPHRDPDGHSAVMPALHRVLMASPLHRLVTSRVLAPWALQGIRPTGEVLEIGAGVGAVAARLLLTTPRLRMVVTDYDPAMVAIAERFLRPFSGRVGVACADACDLPFEDDRFDLGLSMAMLHHTGDWRRAVGEAIRVLRPGGGLVGYDLLEGVLLHRRSQPGTMMRRGQLEEVLATLPVADARIKSALGSRAIRFLITKDATTSISHGERGHVNRSPPGRER